MQSDMKAADVDAFQFFKEEFTESDGEGERLEAIHNLKFVASSLGPSRTRNELLPFLGELPSQIGEGTDDELLHALAAEYLTLADFVGGEDKFALFIPPLKFLAGQEESIVREKAVETLCALLEQKCSVSGKPTFARTQLLPALETLSSSEIFPARASACGLISAVYPHLDPARRADVRKIYCELCQDEMPMVRRTAASRLASVFKVCDKQIIISQLMPTLHLCWKDPLQDLIRAAAVNAAIQFAQQCTAEEFRHHVSPTIVGAAKDPSWRARIVVAQRLDELMEFTTPEIVRTELAPILKDMIHDPESEVQSAAIAVVGPCVQFIDVETLETLIYPTFASVITGAPVLVRAKLAGAYGTLAQKFGKQKTLALLVSHILALIGSECREVRLEITSQLSDVCQVLGSESSVEVFLDATVNLMNDPQWRIRLTLVKQLPRLASFFGKASFSHSRWEELQFAALLDNIHAVREAAVENIGALVSCFGQDWATDNLLPQLLDLYKKSTRGLESKDGGGVSRSPGSRGSSSSQNNLIITDNQHGGELACRSIESYLSRNTLLHALEQAALSVSRLDAQLKLLPLMIKAGSDAIANVRFTSVRVLANLTEQGAISDSFLSDTVIPHLRALAEKDSDVDVRYFAIQAQSRCQLYLAGHRSVISPNPSVGTP